MVFGPRKISRRISKVGLTFFSAFDFREKFDNEEFLSKFFYFSFQIGVQDVCATSHSTRTANPSVIKVNSYEWYTIIISNYNVLYEKNPNNQLERWNFIKNEGLEGHSKFQKEFQK